MLQDNKYEQILDKYLEALYLVVYLRKCVDQADVRIQKLRQEILKQAKGVKDG